METITSVVQYIIWILHYISLTYSLMNPTEVSNLRAIIGKECKTPQDGSKESVPKLAIENAVPSTDKQNVTVQNMTLDVQVPDVPNHALDPANNNILPLESTLVPY